MAVVVSVAPYANTLPPVSGPALADLHQSAPFLKSGLPSSTKTRTGFKSFDVECQVLSQSLERMHTHWNGSQKVISRLEDRLGVDETERLVPPGSVNGAFTAASRRDTDSLEQLDLFGIEISIVRRALMRIQGVVGEVCRSLDGIRCEAGGLRSENETLRAENQHLQNVVIRSSTLPDNNIPEKRQENPDVFADLEQPKTPPLPRPFLDQEAIRSHQCSLWAHLLRHLIFSDGVYHFLVDSSNAVLYRRTLIAKEAAVFGLSPISDALFNCKRPNVVIQRLTETHPDHRFIPKPHQRAQINKPKGVKGGEALVILDPPSPRRDCEEGENQFKVKRSTVNPLTGGRTEGVVSFLGTNNFSCGFQNPAVGRIKAVVGASSLWGQSDPATLLSDRLSFFCTRNLTNQWISVDFLDNVILPRAYSIVSFHPILSGYYPRDWVLEGSMDGMGWTTLIKHSGDTSLGKLSPVATWKIGDEEELKAARSGKRVQKDLMVPAEGVTLGYYRVFRIRQTGPNSFGSGELQVSSIEIFGDIMYVAEREEMQSPVLPNSRSHVDVAWDDAWALPLDTKGGKKGKKR